MPIGCFKFKLTFFAVLSCLPGQSHFTVGLFSGGATELPDAAAAAGEQLAGELADHGVVAHQLANRRASRHVGLRNIVPPVPRSEPQLRSQEQQHDLRSTPARRQRPRLRQPLLRRPRF